jgi:hypothetical protein
MSPKKKMKAVVVHGHLTESVEALLRLANQTQATLQVAKAKEAKNPPVTKGESARKRISKAKN